MITRGLFSVESAYHVLHDRKSRNSKRQKGENSSRFNQLATNDGNWKSIWKLKFPPKVRHFFSGCSHKIVCHSGATYAGGA